MNDDHVTKDAHSVHEIERIEQDSLDIELELKTAHALSQELRKRRDEVMRELEGLGSDLNVPDSELMDRSSDLRRSLKHIDTDLEELAAREKPLQKRWTKLKHLIGDHENQQKAKEYDEKTFKVYELLEEHNKRVKSLNVLMESIRMLVTSRPAVNRDRRIASGGLKQVINSLPEPFMNERLLKRRYDYIEIQNRRFFEEYEKDRK